MKQVLNILIFLAWAVTAFAQGSIQTTPRTVTLVADGEGPTKTSAEAAALRSAVEQAFGAFVSANTSFVNDDIVRDEIATISSGNIQSYEVLSSTRLPDGNISTTLSAVVSIDNLVTYARAKGSSCEFAGATFAMAVKMRKLNKENEALALEHLLKKLAILSENMFDISVEVNGEAQRMNCDKLTLDIDSFYGRPYVRRIDDGDHWFGIPLVIRFRSNSTTNVFYNLLFETLEALGLSENEQENYKTVNEPYYYMTFIGDPYEQHDSDMTLYVKKERTYCLRNDPRVFLSAFKQVFMDSILHNKALQASGLQVNYRFAEIIERENTLSDQLLKQYEHSCAEFISDKKRSANDECVLFLPVNQPEKDAFFIRMALPTIDYDTGFRTVYIISGDNLYARKQLFSVLGHNKRERKDIDLRAGRGDALFRIDKLFSFPDVGTTLYEIKFDFLVKEDDLYQLSGFKIERRSDNTYSAASSGEDCLDSNALDSSKNNRANVSNQRGYSKATLQDEKKDALNEDHNAIPFQLVQVKPSFNGGDVNEFSKWVNAHMQVPQEFKERGLSGRVSVLFCINIDGSVSNVSVTRSTHAELENEAIRVIEASPKWSPGFQNGEPTAVSITFPVLFR